MSPLPGQPLVPRHESRIHVFGAEHPLQQLASTLTIRAAAMTFFLFAGTFLATQIPKLLRGQEVLEGGPVTLAREMRTELPQTRSISSGPSGPVVPGFKPGGRPPTAALGIPDPVPDLQAEAPTIASQTEMGMPIDPNGIEGLGGGGSGGWASAASNLDEMISGPIDTLISGDAFQVFDQAPIPISVPRPRYPRMAEEARIEGIVTLRVLVGTNGKVQKAVVLDGPEVFHDSAKQAALRTVFKPALQQNRPVPANVRIPIRFTLNK